MGLKQTKWHSVKRIEGKRGVAVLSMKKRATQKKMLPVTQRIVCYVLGKRETESQSQ